MQPANLVVPAPDVDAGAAAGALRGKRKNAGINRRYSEEDYVVDGAEEVSCASARRKRRRTAQALEGPIIISSHLLDAADASRDQHFPASTVKVPDPLTAAPDLACLAAVAVANCSASDDDLDINVEDDDIDHLDSAMELD